MNFINREDLLTAIRNKLQQPTSEMEQIVNFSLIDKLDTITIFVVVYFATSVYGYYRLGNFPMVSRVYSTLHTITSVGLALLYLLTWSSIVYSVMVCNSIAYCLYDTVVITLGMRIMHVEPLMYIHHIAFLFGIVGKFARGAVLCSFFTSWQCVQSSV